MIPLSLKLKQEPIKLVRIPAECIQDDFVKKSGRDRAIRLVCLPFPILSIIISKYYLNQEIVISE